MNKKQRRMTRVFYVNRPMLAFTLFGAGTWLIGFPLLMAVLTEHSAWLNYAVLGAVLLPVLALLLVLGRVLAWVVLYVYWPLQVVLATAAIVLLSAVVIVYYAEPPLIIQGFSQPLMMGTVNVPAQMQIEPARVPTSIFIAAGAALMFSLAMMLALSRLRRNDEEEAELPLPRVEHDEPPQPKPLTYLEQRQRTPRP